MKIASKTPVNTDLRDKWLHKIEDLHTEIRQWVSQEPDWTTKLSKTESIYEDLLGEYTAPLLTIHSPEGELRVEPIARNYPGRGIVELYAWPTLYRVRLTQAESEGDWRVRTDSGIYLRQEWNRENFITLIRDLVSAAA